MFAEPLLIHSQVCLAGVFQTVGSADPQKVYFNSWYRLHHRDWGALSAQRPFKTPIPSSHEHSGH